MPDPSHARSGWVDGWHVTPYQVMFRDLDPFGHVNNAVYLTYFEWGRTQLWFDLLGGEKPGDISFIVARAEIDFREQIELEPIEIRTRIGTMRNTSFDFLYEIRKAAGRQIAAIGKVVVVLFDWKTRSKVTIGDDLRRKVTSLQNGEA